MSEYSDRKDRNRRCIILGIVLLALIGVGLLIGYQLPIQEEVQLELPAVVYRDGTAAGETTIRVDGMVERRLLGDYAYFGGRIELGVWDGETDSGGPTSVWWNSGKTFQTIHILGENVPCKVASVCLIGRDLQSFALQLEDNSIIATSEELYWQLYAVTKGEYSSGYELPVE